MCSYNIDLFVAYMYAMKHVDVSCMDHRSFSLSGGTGGTRLPPPPFFLQKNSTALLKE